MKKIFILLIIVIGCSTPEGKVQKIKPKKGTITQESQESRVKNQELKVKSQEGTITVINWLTSIEEAEKKGSETGLPLMIDFYATWCVWCKRLDETTFKDKDVLIESLNFIPVKLDCTRDSRIAQEYRILGFPTIVFMGTNGTRYDVVGFKKPKDFILEMKKAKEKFK